MSHPNEPPAEQARPVDDGTGQDSGRAPRGRPKAAWTAVTIGVVLAVVLVVFIAQNTQRVDISFLGWEGTVPLSVSMLGAATVGAALVLLVGTIRVTQLRIAERRLRRRDDGS